MLDGLLGGLEAQITDTVFKKCTCSTLVVSSDTGLEKKKRKKKAERTQWTLANEKFSGGGIYVCVYIYTVCKGLRSTVVVFSSYFTKNTVIAVGYLQIRFIVIIS